MAAHRIGHPAAQSACSSIMINQDAPLNIPARAPENPSLTCCRYGQGGSTPIQTALENFSGAVRRGTAPAPTPLHAARHRDDGCPAAAVDTNLQLLRLYAGLTNTDGEADLAALLDPAGYSREPMDARLAWTLHSVLRAIDVLPPGTDQRPQVQTAGLSCVGSADQKRRSVNRLVVMPGTVDRLPSACR